MAVDFAIAIDGADGEMTFNMTTDIMNNVWLSLMTPMGSFFQNIKFGSRLHLLQRSKNTDQTARLAKSYCEEALSWLVQTGRAASVDVGTEIDKSSDPYRLKLLVTVAQADGRTISFELWKEVV